MWPTVTVELVFEAEEVAGPGRGRGRLRGDHPWHVVVDPVQGDPLVQVVHLPAPGINTTCHDCLLGKLSKSENAELLFLLMSGAF